MKFFSYHLQAALYSIDTLCRKPLSNIIIIFVLALVLALPLLLWVLTDNVSQFTKTWQQDGRISLYLQTTLSEADIQAFVTQLRANPSVGQVTMISPEQGLDELMHQEGMQDIMRYLPQNPLPVALELLPSSTLQSPDALQHLYQALKAYPEVQLAKVDMDWVRRLHVILSFATEVVHTLMFLLAFAVLFIVGNTLRLALHHREQEIQVFKLVGATDAFILRPFLYQGFFYGVMGAVFAVLLVNIFMLSLEMAIKPLTSAYKMNYEIFGLSMRQILMLFAFASILGWLGARLSVKKQLVSIEP